MLRVRADLLVEAQGKVGRVPRAKVGRVPRAKVDQKDARLAGPLGKPEVPARVVLRGVLPPGKAARVVVARLRHLPRRDLTVSLKACGRVTVRDRYA